MSSAVKRAVIGYCVAFGNMFFAHGLFFVLAYLFNDGASFLFYVLQLILNIVLHFAVLKKRFEPVKERNPLFYFLLAVTAGAVWTGAFFIFTRLALDDIIDVSLWENYPETLPRSPAADRNVHYRVFGDLLRAFPKTSWRIILFLYA